MSLIAFIARRLFFYIIPSMLGIVVFCFLVLKLLPGDAADVLAVQSGESSAEGVDMIRRQMGLDLPVLEQLITYVTRLAHGDLGMSVRFNMPVTTLIMERLPNTLLLMSIALAMAIVIGVIAGWIMAIFRTTMIDRVLQVLVLILYSTPGFWIGLMLIVFFSVKLGWLPNGGNMTVGTPLYGMDYIIDRLRHMALPSIALSAFYVAIYAPLMRATMVEVQQQDYMRTAAAKGLHPFTIQLRHAFRNALIPVTTMAGLHLGNMLGGAVVIETVFNWPGMGRLALEAVMGRDFNVLLGVLLLSSLVVIIANTLIDLLQMWIDPRIEAQ